MKCQFCHADLPDNEEHSHVCNTGEDHLPQTTQTIVETTPEGLIVEIAPNDTGSETPPSTEETETVHEHEPGATIPDAIALANGAEYELVETTPEGLIVEKLPNDTSSKTTPTEIHPETGTEYTPDLTIHEEITSANIVEYQFVETTPEGLIVETTSNDTRPTNATEYQVVETSPEGLIIEPAADDVASKIISITSYTEITNTSENPIDETTPGTTITDNVTHQMISETSTDHADATIENDASIDLIATVTPDSTTISNLSEEKTIVSNLILTTTPEGIVVEAEKSTTESASEIASYPTIIATPSYDELTPMQNPSATPLVEQSDTPPAADLSEEKAIAAGFILETTPEGTIVGTEKNTTEAVAEVASYPTIIATPSYDELTRIQNPSATPLVEQSDTPPASYLSEEKTIAAGFILETTPEGAIVATGSNSNESQTGVGVHPTIIAATSNNLHTQIENAAAASSMTEAQQAPSIDQPERIKESSTIQSTDPRTERLLEQEQERPSVSTLLPPVPAPPPDRPSSRMRLLSAGMILLVIILIALPLLNPDWATGAGAGALIATCIALALTIVVIIRSVTSTAIRSKTQWLKQDLGRTILIVALILYSGFSLFAQSTIHVLQAHWLESQQRWSQAISEYQASGENPNHGDDIVRTTIEWGETESAQHNYVSAISHLNTALVNAQPVSTTLTQRAQKDKIQTMTAQGNLYLTQHNYAGAISNYQGIRTLSYCDTQCVQQIATLGSTAYYNLAEQDLDRQEYDGATENFATLLKDFKVVPNAARVHNDMAQALFGRGKENLTLDCPKAVPDYQELARSYGDTPEGQEATSALKEKQHITGHFTTAIPQSSSEVPVVIFVQGLNGNLTNTQIGALALASPFSIVQPDGTFTSPDLPQGTYDLVWGVLDSNGLEISDIYYQANLINPYYVAQLGPLCPYNFGDITDSSTATN